MSEFEDLLRASLRRKDPPPGLAARLLRRLPARRGTSRGRWAMAAAASVLVVLGAVRYQEYQEGLAAKRALLMALEITAEKMSVAESAAQTRIRQWNQRSDNR